MKLHYTVPLNHRIAWCTGSWYIIMIEMLCMCYSPIARLIRTGISPTTLPSAAFRVTITVLTDPLCRALRSMLISTTPEPVTVQYYICHAYHTPQQHTDNDIITSFNPCSFVHLFQIISNSPIQIQYYQFKHFHFYKSSPNKQILQLELLT